MMSSAVPWPLVPAASFPRGGSRGRVQGVHTPLEMTSGFVIQLVFCQKKKMWFIGVEVEQETSAPPPGSARVSIVLFMNVFLFVVALLG